MLKRKARQFWSCSLTDISLRIIGIYFYLNVTFKYYIRGISSIVLSPLGPPAPSNGHGPQVVVVDSFDLPPNYSAVTGDTPSVTCRVCQTNIDISGKRDQHVVKCNFCGEATPIRNAPQGRKYVRCPCNCLLICKNTSQVRECQGFFYYSVFLHS